MDKRGREQDREATLGSPKILMSIMAGRAYLSRKRGHLAAISIHSARNTSLLLSLSFYLPLYFSTCTTHRHSLLTPAGAPKAEAGHVLHLQLAASCLKLAPTFLRMKLSVWHSLSGCCSARTEEDEDGGAAAASASAAVASEAALIHTKCPMLALLHYLMCFPAHHW